MARIRVGLLPTSSFMVGTLPVPKYADQEKTQFATDRETGAKLYTITLFFMEEDRAEALKITVPETGLPNGLRPGSPGHADRTVRHPVGRGSSTARSRTASPTARVGWTWCPRPLRRRERHGSPVRR
jgi:hypothetical protein